MYIIIYTLEICTAGLEFESGRTPLVRAWNSRSLTRSPGPTKYVFRKVEFPRIQKKKKFDRQNKN
jgi:hypothetical protein